MYCKNCGTLLGEGIMQCPNCGHIVAQADLQAAHAGPMAAQAPVYTAGKTAGKAVRSWIIAAVVIIAIISAGLIIYNVFFAQRPINTVKKFVNAINEKDINKAVTCLDPSYEKLYNAAGSILTKFTGGINIKDIADLFPAMYEFSKESGNLEDEQLEIKKVVSQKINGKSAVIVVNINCKSTDENGVTTEEPVKATFYLTKFSEGWRIDNIK